MVFAMVVCAAGESPLGRVAFVYGEWATKGPSELGDCEGVATFAPDVENHVVTRRSWLKFSSGANAGTRHEDLLIIYPEGEELRAIYFDGEGHVIHYKVTTPSASTAVFESDPAQPGPRFRLTHAIRGKRLETKFEIAMPGAEFKTHISGMATRK
jgi:hypothetical protein